MFPKLTLSPPSVNVRVNDGLTAQDIIQKYMGIRDRRLALDESKNNITSFKEDKNLDPQAIWDEWQDRPSTSQERRINYKRRLTAKVNGGHLPSTMVRDEATMGSRERKLSAPTLCLCTGFKTDARSVYKFVGSAAIANLLA